MIRSFVTAAALSAAVLLSGCASTGNGGFPNAATLVAQVKAFTIQLCQFEPLITGPQAQQLIAAYYPAGVPIQQAVATIGNAICEGRSPQAVGRYRGGGVTYKLVSTPRGPVRVPGRYVR